MRTDTDLIGVEAVRRAAPLGAGGGGGGGGGGSGGSGGGGRRVVARRRRRVRRRPAVVAAVVVVQAVRFVDGRRPLAQPDGDAAAAVGRRRRRSGGQQHLGQPARIAVAAGVGQHLRYVRTAKSSKKNGSRQSN